MPQPDITTRASLDGMLTRSYAWEDLTLRENSETGGWTFEGVASVVDHPYPVRDQWGEYVETIKPGAFNKSLRDSTVPIAFYANHQTSGFPFAARSATAATLTLSADPNLRVRAELDPQRPDVQILRSVVTRGEMPEMSIGFRPVKARDKWAKDYAAVDRHEINLREVSVVPQGANTGGTLTSMRSLDEFMESLTDIEMDGADIDRAIAYFETRRPVVVNPFAERDAADRARLERLRRPPA